MTPKVSFIVALNKTQDQQSPHMHALNAYAKANDGDILVGRDLLYAATGDVVILIEDILCDLGPMFKAYENFTNDEDVILGVAQQRRRHIFFDQWVNTILAKDLCYDPCIFRIIPQEKLGKLLGRIYLKDRGFNLEWAYVSHKLNYKTSLITIDVKDRLQLKPSLKLFWDIIKLRMWHFPMINRHDQHMSDKDVSDMYAHESNHWWFVAKANFMKKILCIWLPHHPHSILDAGCGTGHNMRFLAEKGCYVGLDVSAQALRFCQNNGHKTLVQGNLDHVPFKEASFDVIFSLDVIEHTQNPERAIRQLKRALKPNGHIILTVPAFRFLFSPHDEALSHLRRYNRGDVQSLLKNAGFEIKHMQYLYFFSFIPVAIIRLFRKLLIHDDKPATDMYYKPIAGVDKIMSTLLDIEVALLGKVSMPFGTTIVTVAMKK